MSFVAVAAGGGALLGGVASAIGGNAAANTQAEAALNAANLQANTAQNSLNFQGNVLNTQIANQQPWYQSGVGALNALDYGMGIIPGPSAQGVSVPGMPTSGPSSQSTGSPTPLQQYSGPQGGIGAGIGAAVNAVGGRVAAPAVNPVAPPVAPPGAIPSPGNTGIGQGSLLTPFTAPTNVTEQNDPGYQFRLQQGQQAIERSAAAQGNLFTGGTGKALANYAQNNASNEYANVYNRAFNTFENNQTNTYNRLAALSGTGQVSTNNMNSNLSTGAATAANTMQNAATQIGQQGNNAAAATASGYVNSANAANGAISGIGNAAMMPYVMNALNGYNPSSAYGTVQGLMSNPANASGNINMM